MTPASAVARQWNRRDRRIIGMAASAALQPRADRPGKTPGFAREALSTPDALTRAPCSRARAPAGPARAAVGRLVGDPHRVVPDERLGALLNHDPSARRDHRLLLDHSTAVVSRWSASTVAGTRRRCEPERGCPRLLPVVGAVRRLSRLSGSGHAVARSRLTIRLDRVSNRSMATPKF
jgi:hypothetical protein